MGQKDITQKNFEAYNDVFSDIVNGTLFDGREVIKPEALVDAMAKSQYKADDNVIHEQERDVAKYWTDKIAKNSWSKEQAMEFIGIPKSEFAKYAALL